MFRKFVQGIETKRSVIYKPKVFRGVCRVSLGSRRPFIGVGWFISEEPSCRILDSTYWETFKDSSAKKVFLWQLLILIITYVLQFTKFLIHVFALTFTFFSWYSSRRNFYYIFYHYVSTIIVVKSYITLIRDTTIIFR